MALTPKQKKMGAGIVVFVIFIMFISMMGSDTKATSSQMLQSPAASIQKSATNEQILINFQVDNELISVTNVTQNAYAGGMPLSGWDKDMLINLPSKPGDIIEIVVRNAGGPGGLRAVAKRGNIVYKTGSNAFTVNGTPTINVMGTSWKWAATDVWNPQSTAKTIAAMGDAEWVWSNNMCETCDVTFRLLV